ncbi:MAG: PadR family transcriptional regulator, partial [Devosiaceae bacterium]|nr:PadR family transcriptional regulator [Devosiaceae bacterium MH13]
MNVRTLCLAILHHQDATGYEIRKLSTEGKYAYFVDASFGSIYPALAKLEDDGLVTSRQEQQVGKPPRKVYMINDAGRQALRAHLREAPSPDVFRSEFLLIGMCSDLLDEGDLGKAFDVHLGQIEQEIVLLEEMCGHMVDHGQGSWLASYGLNCMQARRGWLEANRDDVIAQANLSAREGKAKRENSNGSSGDEFVDAAE